MSSERFDSNPPASDAELASSRAPEEPAPDTARFREFVEHFGDIFWIIDVPRHRQVYVSPSCERRWGYPLEALYRGPPHWAAYVHPDDRAMVDEAFASLGPKPDVQVEYRLRCADGDVRWLRDRAVAVLDGTGQVARVMGVTQDITDQRASTRYAVERERRLNLALRASGLYVWTFNVSGHQLAVADALCAALRLSPRDCACPGQWRRRLAPEDRVRVTQAFRDCLNGGPDIDVEFRVILRDGEWRWLSVRAILTFNERAQPKLYGVCADITDRARVQQDRERLHAAERAARERAESAARARDQFLAIVSHELRSPLNGIQSWSNVLERQLPADAPPTMWRAITGIKNGVNQQVRLIEDLLDATRIMSGNLSLSMTAFEVRPVVEAALASVSALAASRQIEILPDLALTRERMRGDADRMQQIIWNLLSNALKFTPAGGHVWVTLKAVGHQLRLDVTDDGKGIDADFMPHLFEWFRRDETASHRGHDGLGLGLALVRHLTELHGGTVSASSPGVHQGASFEVRLPLLPDLPSSVVAPVDATQRAVALPSLAGLRVMLIDDQADARESVPALLSGLGVSVWAFASGADALTWLSAATQWPPVDVLLCDLAMPVNDGYATLAQIRELEDTRGVPPHARLRALALTAYAQREEHRRALDAGFLMHLSKPVSALDLANAIAGCVRKA